MQIGKRKQRSNFIGMAKCLFNWAQAPNRKSESLVVPGNLVYHIMFLLVGKRLEVQPFGKNNGFVGKFVFEADACYPAKFQTAIPLVIKHIFLVIVGQLKIF
jgi:hypothetical protein